MSKLTFFSIFGVDPVGTVWKGKWVEDYDYERCHQVASNGEMYICLENHTSTTDSEPETGEDWEIYWVHQRTMLTLNQMAANAGTGIPSPSNLFVTSDTLDSEISSLLSLYNETGASALADDISNLSDALSLGEDELQSNITALSAKVGSDIASLSGHVHLDATTLSANLQSKLNTLSVNLDAHGDANISALTSDVYSHLSGNLESHISMLSGSLQSKITALSGLIDTSALSAQLESDISAMSFSLQGRINALSAAMSAGDVNVINSLKSNISGMSGSLQSNITALSAAMSTADSAILNSLKSNISAMSGSLQSSINVLSVAESGMQSLVNLMSVTLSEVMSLDFPGFSNKIESYTSLLSQALSLGDSGIISMLASDIGSLSGQISLGDSALSSLLTALSTKLTSDDSSLLSHLHSDITALSGAVSGADSNLQSNINVLSTNLVSADTSYLNSAKSNISAMSGSLQSNIGSLSGVMSAADSNLQSNINALSVALDSHEDANVSALSLKLTSDINTLSNNLTSVDVSNLNSAKSLDSAMSGSLQSMISAMSGSLHSDILGQVSGGVSATGSGLTSNLISTAISGNGSNITSTLVSGGISAAGSGLTSTLISAGISGAGSNITSLLVSGGVSATASGLASTMDSALLNSAKSNISAMSGSLQSMISAMSGSLGSDDTTMLNSAKSLDSAMSGSLQSMISAMSGSLHSDILAQVSGGVSATGSGITSLLISAVASGTAISGMASTMDAALLNSAKSNISAMSGSLQSNITTLSGDARFSDARTPVAHNQAASTITAGTFAAGNFVFPSSLGLGGSAPGTVLHTHLATQTTNTVNALLISRWTRPQTGGVKWGNSFDILMGSYGTDITSQTRVDFKLADGNTDLPDTVVMTLQGNQYVGIGTTGPGRKLDVLDASNPQLRLTHTAASVYTDFLTNSAGALTINPTGLYMGICGATPNSTAVLAIPCGDASATYSKAAIALGYAGSGGYWHFIHSRHNSGGPSGNAIDFYVCDNTAAGVFPTNSTHCLTMDCGKVGVGGVTTPTSTLHVGYLADTVPATYQGRIKVSGATTSSLQEVGGVELVVADGYGCKIQAISASGAALTFGMRNNSATWSETMRITAGGNVGIGCTPAYKFQVLGDITVGSTAGGGGVLYLHGNTATNVRSSLYTSNGSLHIDCHAGYNTYINYNSGASVLFGAGAYTSIDNSGNITASAVIKAGTFFQMPSDAGYEWWNGPFGVAGNYDLFHRKISDGSWTCAFSVNTQCNVGIGTYSQACKLDVAGITKANMLLICGGAAWDAGCIYTDSNWGMLYRAYCAGNVNSHAWYTSAGSYLGGFLNGGNLGIATQAPAKKFEVLDASAAQLRLTHTAASVYTDFQTQSTGVLSISPAGSLPTVQANGAYLGWNLNTQTMPTSTQGFGVLTWNQSGGSGEVDIWDTYGGGFSFYTKTGTSTALLSMRITGAGNISAAGTVTGTNINATGGVLQVVSSAATSATTTSANTSLLSLSITPSSSSNKVFALFTGNIYYNLAYGPATLVRTSTVLFTFSSFSACSSGDDANYTFGSVGFLDSPGTASAVTYYIKVTGNVSGVAGICNGILTLFEIKG